MTTFQPIYSSFNLCRLSNVCNFPPQISGGVLAWAQVALETVQEQCLQRLERDVTLWKITTSGQLLPPMSVLEQLCPKDCSGRGRCSAGEDEYCFC